MVVISTYSQIGAKTNNSDIYYMIQWLSVWLDEGHKIKNNKTQTNNNVHQLQSTMRVVITGKCCLVLLCLFNFCADN